MSYLIQADEVVLYESEVKSEEYGDDSVLLMLTSQCLVIEKQIGCSKKERELCDQISLTDVKMYNGNAQVKQRGNKVDIQTVQKNITLEFPNIFESYKFIGKMIDVVTGTNLAQRASNATKSAFELVDDTLGFDTRGTVKNVLEQGIAGTLIKGIGKKNS